MGPRNNYLCSKVIKDKFIALEKRKGDLTTWSLATGRLLGRATVPGTDWNEYKVY